MTKETIANVVSTLKQYNVYCVEFGWTSSTEKIMFGAMSLKERKENSFLLTTYTPTLDAAGDTGKFDIEWCINIIIDRIIKDADELDIIRIDGSLELDGDGILYDAELTTAGNKVTGHLTD